MALGKRLGSSVKREDESLGLGLGRVRYTRSVSGKRISISSNMDMEVDSTVATPSLKRQCSEKIAESFEKSMLEDLPQDVLVSILCSVEHDDLKQLFHVSKLIREATLIAKSCHFAYSTPSKTLKAFRNCTDLGEEAGDFEEAEAPNAPKQFRAHRSRMSGKKLADISVALFASPDQELSGKDLFMATELETHL